MKRYLVDLADTVRAAGLVVHEVAGWQTRGRRNGSGYDRQPDHVMVHHTASPRSADGERDVAYIVSGSPVAPISNLYLNRAGHVWICAAGPTNTNGAGSAPWASWLVADGDMNRHAIGVEAANAGNGEPWPTVQTDAYVRLVRALCDRYLIPVDFVRAHHEWAPRRKIDPAGPSPWAPNGGPWDMAAFRRTVHAGDVPTPTPTPTPKEDRMLYIAVPKFPGAGADTPWFAVFESGAVRRAVNTDVAYANAAGVRLIDLDSAEHHAYLTRLAGL